MHAIVLRVTQVKHRVLNFLFVFDTLSSGEDQAENVQCGNGKGN